MKSLSVFIIAVILATPLAAQETTGAIAGRIVDAQGLPVPGVTVTATDAQGSKGAITDSDGRFTVPFLVPGDYSVHAELQSFSPADRGVVQVRLGQTTDIPLTMAVGALTETIQVVAAATAPVETGSTTIGANLDSATLANLPVGRRFSDTLYLAPGVSTGGNIGVANPSVEGSSG